jgi:hypothetical protein
MRVTGGKPGTRRPITVAAPSEWSVDPCPRRAAVTEPGGHILRIAGHTVGLRLKSQHWALNLRIMEQLAHLSITSRNLLPGALVIVPYDAFWSI